VRYRRARCLGLAVAASLVLSACSELDRGSVSVTTPNGHTTPSGAPSTERPSAPSTAKLRNDLKKGRVTRSLEAGALQVTVKYSLENRVQRWSPGVGQPLDVSRDANTSATRRSILLTDRSEDVSVAESLLISVSQMPQVTWIRRTPHRQSRRQPRLLSDIFKLLQSGVRSAVNAGRGHEAHD
jgi:hypothetical protein